MLVASRIMKKSQGHFIAQWQHTGELNGQIEETFSAHALVKVFGRGRWPGGVNSVVRVENGTHAGREFDQDGEAVVFDRSPMTAHYEVNLTARAPESH